MTNKGWFQQSSLYARFLWISLPMALMIVGIIYYSQITANQAASQSLHAIKYNNQQKANADKINSYLQSIEKQIYRHTVYLDSESRENINEDILKLKISLDQAHITIEKENNDNKQAEIINELEGVVRNIETQIEHYYQIINNVSLRFPGMPVLLNELLVHNTTFLQAVDGALVDFRQTTEGRRVREAEELFIKARYAWVQQVSWFRLFVANRSGIFGSPQESMQLNLINREIYMRQIGEYLSSLSAMDKRNSLDLQASESLEIMFSSYAEYKKYFKEAKDIYISDEWRADYPFLKNTLQPEFKKASALLSKHERYIDAATNTTLEHSSQIAGKITASLWWVAVVVLLIIATAFLMFEYLLRRPIAQVAVAIDAEARGELFLPLINSNTQEIKVLVDAFSNMREQVHSRQRRLASILENAGEGIITINDEGNIESFNSAAEKLFGYDDSEVMGKSIETLIPEQFKPGHGKLFKNATQRKTGKQFRLELEVSAESKDGRVFPVSIKISELEVDGKSIFTAIIEDISERKAMIENLRQLAEHDSLTGLYNRFYFMEELDRVVSRTRREGGRRNALLYIDLDNFKYTNDILGHLAGDCLLVEVAELLKDRTRKSDLLARIGGDEFAILLYAADEIDASNVAEEYRKKLQEYIFMHEGKIVDVGCSIGIAMLEDEIKGKDEILSRADFSCHIAKLEGRNKIHLYTDKDKTQIDNLSDDIGWVQRIKKSLEGNHFIVAKQVIASSSTLECDKYEILLRMVDDNSNLIMPSGFISAAERFGLMVDIDKWVINHAIEMLERESKDFPDMCYSINLSAQSFDSSEVMNLITNKTKQHDINPNSLTFEITETVAMADISLAIKFLTKLRKLGCKTALDDFGVGYSSFAYLKDLPVDYVKIDGSFVKDAEDNPLNKTILKSLNDVAQAMGKQTVAEFVETDESAKMLKLMGVDYVQGHYIGKPVIPAFEYQRLGLEQPKPDLKIVS